MTDKTADTINYDPMLCHDELMKNIRKRSAYKGGDFSVWQKAAREKLAGLLGLPFETPGEDGFLIEWEKDDDEAGFREIRFSFKPENNCWACAHLLLPLSHVESGKGNNIGRGSSTKGRTGSNRTGGSRIPLIICLQGHSTGMHISLGRAKFERDAQTISGGDRDFALQTVKHGFAALTLEQRAFGERGGTPAGTACKQPAMSALVLGRTLIGERVWDVSRTIDILEKHFPEIDTKRVGLMGNSGGGTITIYAAALETRIAAAMPSCAFCSYRLSIGLLAHCPCNYIPGIMNEFDMGDICGLIAPRPLVVVNGRTDDIFPLEGAEAEFTVTKTLYRAAGSPYACRHIIGGEGHRFYAADAWPVFHELTGWKAVRLLSV